MFKKQRSEKTDKLPEKICLRFKDIGQGAKDIDKNLKKFGLELGIDPEAKEEFGFVNFWPNGGELRDYVGDVVAFLDSDGKQIEELSPPFPATDKQEAKYTRDELENARGVDICFLPRSVPDFTTDPWMKNGDASTKWDDLMKHAKVLKKDWRLSRGAR